MQEGWFVKGSVALVCDGSGWSKSFAVNDLQPIMQSYCLSMLHRRFGWMERR